MLPLKEKLTIQQGRTFRLPVRWEADEFGYAAVASIPQAAPCRVTTVAAHGIPQGWRCAVVSVEGMVELNAELDEETRLPLETAYRRTKVLSTTEVEFNDVNASQFGAYVSGGYIQFRVPHDLTGYIARLSIKDAVGGTVLLSMSTDDGRITIDETNYSINLYISATDTEAIEWTKGVYDLELEAPDGEIYVVMTGSVAVVKEITT